MYCKTSRAISNVHVAKGGCEQCEADCLDDLALVVVQLKVHEGVGPAGTMRDEGNACEFVNLKQFVESESRMGLRITAREYGHLRCARCIRQKSNSETGFQSFFSHMRSCPLFHLRLSKLMENDRLIMRSSLVRSSLVHY